ncbi:FAD-dependent monooxygenase [Streptomyces sp. NBC_01320]|uniref:FAD-dependent monooxygenase n=1 Tax=Streptomyces sp. NBC_01320 TaxID=2903824 RepID=UPI002E15EB45|nr:FAD-dependent monooxygenase [Streptomyces sp. NBC_01320]
MRGTTAQVLVVGAGPTGLTLACDLARHGVKAHLVEKSDRLFPGSRGKGLQPRTQEVFDGLGVISAIQAGASPFPRMMTWKDGRRRGEWDLIGRGTDEPFAPYPHVLMIPQWRTQQILHTRLVKLGGSVAFSTELVALEQTSDHVTAELVRPDGSAFTVTAQYLIAADGGHSTVRQTLGIPMTGAEVDLRATLIADVRVDGLDRDNWHVWPQSPGGSMLLCPLPGTEDFQLSAQFDVDVEPDTSPDGVRGIIAARSHLPPGAVTEVRCASYYRPQAALAERFQDGRVFLAGDAAHVHPPGGGQGLNIGVQDAYNLGWKLGRVLRRGAAPELLTSYQAERLPVAAEVLDLSTKLYRAGRIPEVGSAGRAVQRGRMTSQLSVGYRHGPLAVEARGRLAEDALQAGDRAPDTRDRLFDVFRGPHFTLLAVGCALPAAPGDVVRIRRARDSAVGEIYGEGLFLIRPDGYVGLATHDPADVHVCLRAVGSTESPGMRSTYR